MSHHNVDSYRPAYKDQPHNHSAPQPMYHFGSKQPPPRRNFGFRSRIAERDLLTRLPTKHEMQVFGPGQSGHKYRDVDAMTDSEEEAMDEGFSDDGADRAKRRKTDSDAQSQSTPKWSNPDPYTALPPVSQESSTKKVDFVKLIRKARNESMANQKPASTEDDFISFGDLGEDPNTPPANAPSGPRSAATRSGQPVPVAAPPPSLGKRKRDDDPERLLGPRGGAFHADGRVLAQWRPVDHLSPAPWFKRPNSNDSAIVALHKEILDFYAWVKPQDYEATIREDLINRLAREVRRFKSGANIEPFGSYAAELYLPTGDMDLVCFMPDARVDGFPPTKNQMFRLSNFLERSGIVRPGSMVVIPKARVPILKFVDNSTGLRVDLSFNSTTGTRAVETFKAWRAEYPAMPILVAVVKQFLMLRGLNDNASGGLGGFATICLVTSLIQNFPTSTKTPNLGELLIELFNLYGNLFNLEDIAIRLDPPGYIDKSSYQPLRYEKEDRLCIIDPNRPDNNITGGSNQVSRIFKLFTDAHSHLCQRLDSFSDSSSPNEHRSLLAELVGGNFTAYQQQRELLYQVHARSFVSRGATNGPPPPPPLPSATRSPSPPSPPPPPPATEPQKTTKKSKGVPVPQPPAKSSAPKVQNPSQNTTAASSPRSSIVSDGTTSKKSTKKLLSKVRKCYPHLSARFEEMTLMNVEQVTEMCGLDSVSDLHKDIEKRTRQMNNQPSKLDTLVERVKNAFPEKTVFNGKIPNNKQDCLTMGGWKDMEDMNKALAEREKANKNSRS